MELINKLHPFRGMPVVILGDKARIYGLKIFLIKENSKKPSVYFELGNVKPEEIGTTRGDTSSGLGVLLKRLGAENIEEGHGMDILNPEIVLAKDPDMIMIGGANWNPTDNIIRFGYFMKDEQSKEHLG